MTVMPEPVVRMVKHPECRKVMASVSPNGEPHMIVCGSLMVTEPDTIVVGEVFMYRTVEYLNANPMVEFVVWHGKDAYTIKAKARCRETSGDVFNEMSQKLDKMNMSLVAVWYFDVLEVWDASASSTSGSRVV